MSIHEKINGSNRRELYSFLEKMTSWLKSRKAAGGAHKPHATHVAIRILSDRSLFIAFGGGGGVGGGRLGKGAEDFGLNAVKFSRSPLKFDFIDVMPLITIDNFCDNPPPPPRYFFAPIFATLNSRFTTLNSRSLLRNCDSPLKVAIRFFELAILLFELALANSKSRFSTLNSPFSTLNSPFSTLKSRFSTLKSRFSTLNSRSLL